MASITCHRGYIIERVLYIRKAVNSIDSYRYHITLAIEFLFDATEIELKATCDTPHGNVLVHEHIAK